jgi:hypothetical protein
MAARPARFAFESSIAPRRAVEGNDSRMLVTFEAAQAFGERASL